MSIRIQNLTKIYGSQKAVNDVSFDVNRGEIVGFLGPNGAGKSTTMKITTCYLSATSGKVEVNGFDVAQHSMDVRRSIGYLPEHNPLYTDMYIKEFLRFVGALYGLKGETLTRRVGEMIDICGLAVEQRKKIGQLSKGYRQRVGLAQALIHNPALTPIRLWRSVILSKPLVRKKRYCFPPTLCRKWKPSATGSLLSIVVR